MAARTYPHRRDDADDLGRLIALSRRLVWSEATHRLSARGESMLDWQVLNRLRCEGALTQNELAEQTGQHPTRICRLLEMMEKDGQVRRSRETQDRRKMRVELTAKAHRRLAAVDPEIDLASSQVLAPLNRAERRTLAALLTKLLGAQARPARNPQK